MVVAVFLLIAAVYLASVPGILLVNPDTAVYMGLGRSLARTGTYRFNFEPYAKYPPVFPLMLAGVYATVGERIWVMQAMVALCGVGALLAAYALVKPRAGRWPALGVAVLTAACSWFQSHSSVHIRADVPYVMFSLVALWYAERRIRAPGWSLGRWCVVVVLTLAALYTHLVGVALVGAVVGGALFATGQERKVGQRLVAALIVGAVCAAAVGWWLYRGRDITNRMANYSKHSGLLPKEQTGEKRTVADRMVLRLREWVVTPLNAQSRKAAPAKPSQAAVLAVIGLLVLPGLAAGLRRPRSCSEFYLLGYFAVSTVAGGPTGGERYVLAVVPLLLYYGYVSLRLWGRAAGSLLGKRGATVLPRVLVVVAGVCVLSYGVYVRAKCNRGASKFSAKRRERDRVRVAFWRAAARAVGRHVPQGATVYPGSGNTWAKLHYFAECHVAEVRFSDLGERCLRRMLDERARFVFTDSHRRSKVRIEPLLRDYPHCFELLDRYPEEAEAEEYWALYRIDTQRLRERLAGEQGLQPQGRKW